MEDGFRNYLIELGYQTVTPNGRPSTVYDYLKRIEMVCEYEHMTHEELAFNIGRIVLEYDVGGNKESLRKKSHNSVINALRRFQEFCQGYHAE